MAEVRVTDDNSEYAARVSTVAPAAGPGPAKRPRLGAGLDSGANDWSVKYLQLMGDPPRWREHIRGHRFSVSTGTVSCVHVVLLRLLARASASDDKTFALTSADTTAGKTTAESWGLSAFTGLGSSTVPAELCSAERFSQRRIKISYRRVGTVPCRAGTAPCHCCT